jgi:intracellular multiplication protein IcmE
MRTDDFEGPKSQDTDDQRPDVQDQIHESANDDPDNFNEFDAAPLPGQKGSGQSLGEVWRNNPIIKLVVVVVGVIAVVVGLVMFGGSDDKAPESKVGSAVIGHEAPGSETSESYRDAINEVNQQRLEQAVQQGTSTMPIPTATPDNPPATPAAEEPPVNIDDPLAGWRASNQDTGPEPTLEPTSPQFQNGNGANTQQARVPVGPDPAAIAALSSAMGQQMQNILDKHKIAGAQIMQVTGSDYFDKTGGTGTGADGTTPPETPEIQEILIPAGTIVYAQTLTEASTDAPGPVLARLSSGPLAGARILGTFDDTDNYLTLQFNTVVVNGISQSANAVALDPKTTLPAVATDVDRRYWRRVILPAAARFIEGMGQAVSKQQQTVTVNNGTTVSSQNDLNTKQELAAGLASGTQELGQELDREADNTKVLIKVRAGTPIGILFLEPVVKDASIQ